MSETPATQRSWNTKVPTTGGPVSYLNIFDRQAEIRIPEEMRMGDKGTYLYDYTAHQYRWHPNGLREPE